MAVRHYKMLNASERETLAACVGEGVNAWAGEHLSCGDPAVCTLVALEDAGAALTEEREWILASRSPSGEMLAIGLPCDWPHELARLVLTGHSALSLDPAGVALMRAAGTRFIESLAHGVLAACHPGGPQERHLSCARVAAPQIDLSAWSGYALARCQWGESPALLILLWPAAVLECVGAALQAKGSREPLEPRSRAVRSETVVLDALAGEAELAVEEVATLAIGDVLKLDRAISEPLQVRVRGGGHVCSARLGALQGRAALQLV